MRRAALLVCVTSLAVAGCAGTPPSFTPNVPEARVRLAGTIGTVSAAVDPAAQAAGDVRMTFGRDAIAPLWQRALASALDQSHLFDKSARVLDCRVTIVRMKPPETGATIDTPAVARYQIVDAKSGAVVYETIVDTIGHVGPTANFIGAVRIHDSIDQAVQSNIKGFIERLSTIQTLP